MRTAERWVYPWRCERCKRRGQITLDAHAGAWEGTEAILAAHRARAPRCGGDRGTVRLLMPKRPARRRGLTGAST